MAIRVIMVLLNHGRAAESAATTAFTVADCFDAHLLLLQVQPDPGNLIPAMAEGMTGIKLDEVVERFRAGSRARLAAARQLHTSVVERRESIPGDKRATFTFREEYGSEEEVAARFARLHDLTVLASSEQKGEPPSAIIESVLLQSGRPVLVAPSWPGCSVGRRVVVAWNGNTQASRALAASLPFLVKAEFVNVLTAVPSHANTRPEEVVRYLNWHSVRAQAIQVTAPSPGKVAQILLDQVTYAGADLLVMGAYGAGRLKQIFLGGTTRDVLRHASVPVLLAH